MNNKKTVDAMSRICHRLGYRFGTGAAHRALCEKGSEASAWLLPPTLRMVEGRRHGRATYSLTLYISRSRLRLDATEAASLVDGMYDDALTMFSELSQESFVALVDSLKIETKNGGLRPDAGAEIAVTANVETIF